MGPTTPHPWLQVDPRAPHKVFYSFPPVAHGGARPSIVARLDASSLASDGSLGVHLTRTSASGIALAELRAGTIDTSKASLVARLHARTPRDMLLCFLGAFADVLLFEAATVADACRLALEWTRRAIQPGSPLPVAMFRVAAWEGPCRVAREDGLLDRLSDVLDPAAHFSDVRLYTAAGDDGVWANAALLSEACAGRRRRATRGLHWTWSTLRKLGNGMARQLATVSDGQDINHINALEEMRLPRPLLRHEAALAHAWARWLDPRHDGAWPRPGRLSVLARCLGLDMATHYQGFDHAAVFQTRYRGPAASALLDSTPGTPPADELSCLECAAVDAARAYAVAGTARKACHAKFLRRQAEGFRAIKSHGVCYGCFVRPYEHRLPCGCSVCARCCADLGETGRAPTLRSFAACPLCDTRYGSTARIRVPPPTAGYRLLELDGGGVRGIVQIVLLQQLQKHVGLPVAMLFDLVTGTSAGGINALTIGRLGWTPGRCRDNFLPMARRIFPRSGALPSIVSKLVSAARVLLFDAIYRPPGPLFQSIVGDAQLRGDRASLYDASPCEQMKVAVTATTASGSSGLLTSYGKDFDDAEPLYTWLQGPLGPSELEAVSVWQSAEITSAAPLYLPAVQVGDHVLQDGIETPLFHSRSEARKLWPHKATHDYALSLGCGVTRSSPPGARHAVGRCLSLTNAFMSPERIFDQQNALHLHTENVYRLDPVLDVGDMRLDDCSKIEPLAQATQEIFGAGGSAWPSTQPLAWAMLASLFYFELSAVCGVEGQPSTMQCTGYIRCRYEDDLRVQHLFHTRYKGKKATMRGRAFPVRGTEPALVQFTVDSWYRPVDMTMGVEGESASLSGFPECIDNLLQQQVAATGPVGGEEGYLKPLPRKRRGTQHATVAKRRRIA